MSALAPIDMLAVLAEREAYPIELADPVAQCYNILASLLSRSEFILKEIARQQYRENGSLGLTIGGREANGKPVGGLSVYCTQTEYKQVWRHDLAAQWIVENLDEAQIAAELQFWMEKCRTDWYLTAMRKRDWFEHFRAAMMMDEAQGYYETPVLGAAELAVRFSPPDLSKVNVVPPVKSAKSTEEIDG